MLRWYREHSALGRLQGGKPGGFALLGGVIGELLLRELGVFDISNSGTGDAVLDGALWFTSRLVLGIILGEVIVRGLEVARRARLP